MWSGGDFFGSGQKAPWFAIIGVLLCNNVVVRIHCQQIKVSDGQPICIQRSRNSGKVIADILVELLPVDAGDSSAALEGDQVAVNLEGAFDTYYVTPPYPSQSVSAASTSTVRVLAGWLSILL